ncbi:oxidoreductase [Ruegeria sp. ANG-R]|uniref:NAD(P)/FAD-dependent oxidoreductase n=1 Tax=Ruegeria sp. ANG-R TaxID=1577903 RepID=UPI00057F29D2|nr:FAD-binding oxidoreductase [Ruegeria sp. ANG-R]KIC41400.1 oxidoreductase [Ruegeria sp. ANG-R]
MRDYDLSLWRQTNCERLDARPLSGDVTVDLAVIGGGYTGCSAALRAAQAGASVCLLEAHQIGHGGSGRNVGLVNAGLWLPPDEIRGHLGQEAGNRLIELLTNAPTEVFDLIGTHGIACEPVRNGTLHCAHSASGYQDLQTRHAQLSGAGAPVELLDAETARLRTGSAAVHGALFDPRAGTIQPLAYVVGLARAAQEAGARIHTQSPVQSLQQEAAGWVIQGKTGTVRARSVIQATNAYHQGIADTAPDYVPVYYFQYATAPLSHNLRASILPQGEGCWDTGLIMTSFRLDQAGRFIIGGMGELSSAGGFAHKAWVKRKLAALYPQLTGQPLSEGWQGRIAMTADHIPKITQIGPNALSVHGFSGRGIGPGTVFGRLMAESLLNEDPSVLPVLPVSEYSENWTGLRRAFFESGAALTHFIKARF